MTSLLQGLLHITDFGGPLSKTALPVVATCFAIQNAVGIPSIAAQTEHVYDLSGGWTFIAATAVSLLARVLRQTGSKDGSISLQDFNWRQLTMSGGVAIWALRLSTYLYIRILKRGEDSRFQKVRTKPRRFLVFWQVQAVWVIICLLPVILVNAIPASVLNGADEKQSLPVWTKATDVVGLALWVTGFVVECTADYQKSKWLDGKAKKLHDEQFITHGLFSRSRYPNYFGDVTLWAGMATTAAGLLATEPVQSALGLSGSLPSRIVAAAAPFMTPSFMAFLFFKVSGIPLSEPKYDRLYGDQKDYQLWKQNTPIFFPRVF